MSQHAHSWQLRKRNPSTVVYGLETFFRIRPDHVLQKLQMCGEWRGMVLTLSWTATVTGPQRSSRWRNELEPFFFKIWQWKEIWETKIWISCASYLKWPLGNMESLKYNHRILTSNEAVWLWLKIKAWHFLCLWCCVGCLKCTINCPTRPFLCQSPFSLSYILQPNSAHGIYRFISSYLLSHTQCSTSILPNVTV